MTAALRIVLAVFLALAALWASVAAGVWLARARRSRRHPRFGDRVAGVAVMVAAAAILSRAPVIDLRFHPLTVWPAAPTPPAQRKPRSTFRAGWTSTLELLELELDHLRATDVVISVGLRPEDIRVDGWPRSNAADPRQPGVILSFGSKHGPLRYLTDRYDGWKANARAIALGLEALRAVDRYGITQRGEQYVGWKAIPASTGGDQDSLALLVRVAKATGYTGPGSKSLFRKALLEAHPDQGGSRELLEQVQDAGRKLGVA